MKIEFISYRQHGFSLIELMIVVAIVGVLAAIAIPSYQHYTSKAKFTEVVQAVSPYKLAVEACALEQGDITSCVNANGGLGQNGIPPAVLNDDGVNSYVKSVIVKSLSGNSVQIEAVSQRIGKDNAEYMLDGTMFENGQILWRKNPQSSCVAMGLC